MGSSHPGGGSCGPAARSLRLSRAFPRPRPQDESTFGETPSRRVCCRDNAEALLRAPSHSRDSPGLGPGHHRARQLSDSTSPPPVALCHPSTPAFRDHLLNKLLELHFWFQENPNSDPWQVKCPCPVLPGKEEKEPCVLCWREGTSRTLDR